VILARRAMAVTQARPGHKEANTTRLVGLIVLMLSLPLLVSAEDAPKSRDSLQRSQRGQMVEVMDVNL
jgi:hypothetical protein